MADITLQQAQEKVDQWIRTYGVRYFNELTNMTILTEEVGELARIMARSKKATKTAIWAMKWPMCYGY